MPNAIAGGGGGDDDDDGGEIRKLQGEVDGARRRRRRAAAAAEDGEGTRKGEEEEEEEKDHEPRRGDGAQFKGEEDLDNHVSLINPSRADNNSESNAGITGAYDAGPNADCPVEPFNLRAERDGGDGYFDGETYVFRRGALGDEEPDAWVEGLGGGDGTTSTGGLGGTAGGVVGKTTAKSNNRVDENGGDEEQLEGLSREELCRRIVPLLATDTETVVGALRRYGDVLRRDKKRRQREEREEKKKRRGRPAGDLSGGDGEANGTAAAAASAVMEGGTGGGSKDGDEGTTSAAQDALSRLTELADALLMGGEDAEVYDRTRSELLAHVERGGAGSASSPGGQKRKRDYFSSSSTEAVPDAAAAGTSTLGASNNAQGLQAAAAVHWEYRGNTDNQIHGPYTTQQMLGWTRAGYFVGEAAVDVRRVLGGGVGSGGEASQTDPPVAAAVAGTEKKGEEAVDDLMADLMESDDDDKEEMGNDGGANGVEEGISGRVGDSKKGVGTGDADERAWERSDEVDFASCL